MKKTFIAIIQQTKGIYVALCVGLDVASEGPTIEEALANLKEATELYLEEFPQTETNKPIITTFEVEQKLLHARELDQAK